MTHSLKSSCRLRVLVAIASFGDGHLDYLRSIIHEYQSMQMDVDVVVLSDSPKKLGLKVEVVVGMPSKNPWTLPFAHKTVFAQRADQYDLFIYSEDDIGVSESNILAFLKCAGKLEADEIAGFFRYELDEVKNIFLTEPWGHYHWKPESVRQRGSYTIAEFTNEHAGFYILNQKQLRRAIASGGFLRKPYCGRYGWPETAATDPYTSCGFRKVICISHLEDFLVHHKPNRYVKELPVSLESFKEQIQTLMDIQDGCYPANTLCDVESKLWPSKWQKNYYEAPSEELLKMVPGAAKYILSIGCGWGATEARLKQRGAEVTAISLDSVIGAVAARRGIEVVHGALDKGFRDLDGRQFDCVLMSDLVHLQRSPEQVLDQCARFVRKGGTLLLGGPNFDRMPWLIKRVFGVANYKDLRNFDSSGFSICSPGTLAKPIKDLGLSVAAVRWVNHGFNRYGLRSGRIQLGSLTAKDWILQARR